MRVRRIFATCLSLSTVVAVACSVPPAWGAAAAWPPHRPDAPMVVQTFPVPVKKPPVDPATKAAAATKSAQAVSWPTPGTALVAPAAVRSTPGAAATGKRVAARAGGLPVQIGAPTAAPAVAATPAVAAAPVPPVRVELLDHPSTLKRGVDGLLLRVRRTDGLASTSGVSLSVDYSAFRHAYG